MKITKAQLRKIIKEELGKQLGQSPEAAKQEFSS